MKLQQALLLLILGSSMLYSSSQAQTLDCSFQDDLDVRGDGSLLVRRVINQTDQTVSVELEYAGEGWLGFAFSELPVMVPNMAVIGLPDTGIVEKYDLTSRSLAGVMPSADSSSLTQQTITQANGVTTLTFTKPLVEEGEVPVVAGMNRFNWAYGSSNTLGQHAFTDRGSVIASFDECLVVAQSPVPPPVTAPVAPPVSSPVCPPVAPPMSAPTMAPPVAPPMASPVAAPVAEPEAPVAMRRTMAPIPSVAATPTWSGPASPVQPPAVSHRPTSAPIPVLQAPTPLLSPDTLLDCSFQDDLDVRGDGSLLLRRVINQVDQTVSVELEYAGEGWLGFAFSELPVMVPNTAVIGLPDTGVVEKYDLTLRALSGVLPAEDSSSLMDHTITQANGITILKFTKPLMEEGEVPVSAGEVRFNWAYGSSNTLGQHAFTDRGSMVTNFPECLEAGETAAPTAAPMVAVPSSDNIVDLGDGRLQAILDRQDGAVQMVLTTDEPAGTITVEMMYAGEAWIGFGFSENGLMPGSKAVIALPDSNTALQYDLNDRNLDDVVPFSTQTLLDSSVSQEDGVTTLTFTKLLEEPGELPISLTDSIFLYAIGFDNTLAVHQIREAVTLSATPTAEPTANSDGSHTRGHYFTRRN